MGEDDEDWLPADPPALEVEIEGLQVVGEILGPAGDVLAVVYDRTVVPFGFQVPERR